MNVQINDILRSLLGIPRYTCARTLFVKTRQDNVDVLIRKQCCILKLRNAGSDNIVIKYIFDSLSFKASKLFAKWRDNIEVMRIWCLVISLELSNKCDLSFITYVDLNKWGFCFICFCIPLDLKECNNTAVHKVSCFFRS